MVIIGYDGVFLSGEISISDEHDFFQWVDVNTYKPDELFSEYMLDALNVYLKRN